MSTTVPFLDLAAIHRPLRAQLDEAARRVLDSNWFVLGPEVDAFEREFAAYCSADYCLGVGNGLDALHLILRGYGIGAGDEVIVPAHTFIATWLAVTYSGARPVPIDPEPLTGNIDPRGIEAAITTKTRAVIAVHLHGQPADTAAIRQVIGSRDIRLIEDAAQAHGALAYGCRVGVLGDAAAFSFYPGKNLGALGDGGAIVSNDQQLIEKVHRLRNYGAATKYQHEEQGWNSRLDELQAAFLRCKLQHLDKDNQARQAAAHHYLSALAGLPGLILPAPPQWASPVWHLFALRTPQRDALQAYLRRHGIDTLIHYPIPPHLQGAYQSQGWREGSFPISEAWARETLSLPMWPGVPWERVSTAVRDFFASQTNQIWG